MRNVFVLLLALGLAIVLVGCGGDAPETAVPTTAPTDTPVVQAAEETTSVEAAETEAAPIEEATDTAEAAEATAAPETEPATEEADGNEAAAEPGQTIARVSFPSTVARSGPGTSFNAVLNVSVNQEFPVIAQTGEGTGTWYLVEIPDGQFAWLWSRVVTIVPEGAEIPPAATVPAP